MKFLTITLTKIINGDEIFIPAMLVSTVTVTLQARSSLHIAHAVLVQTETNVGNEASQRKPKSPAVLQTFCDADALPVQDVCWGGLPLKQFMDPSENEQIFITIN
ncbi:hypothetical protein CDAR_433611 [Caerostris darwini]|uniref:Uncharacterized protein n=1 Tax=Caerostris darwini TaxID=1538125 RepID=A0AAV4QLZ8_9ARAC|nr:hypothetical protein CDAR_433611 [Caerostris darwini]